jgi:toxin ParE1/3/4
MAHRLALRALADLDEIWEYIVLDSGSEAVADRQIDLITEKFDLIANWPRVGRARDELRRGLRSYPVGNYIIFYRVQRHNVIIQHVLHARRDIDRLIGRR